jgi:anti-sigma factor (TIGR02949 family)
MILDTIKRWFGGGSGPEEEPARPGGTPGRTTDDGSSDCPEGGGAPGSGMLSCQEALEWMYEFMDGELPDADADKVDRHFQRCTACYPHLRLEESFRSRLRTAVGAARVPDDVRHRVMDLLAREEAGG